ncbi:MAG: hypothetical protein GY926_16450, partial [bacterium]|nr:hypothetical protein [bacterium]
MRVGAAGVDGVMEAWPSLPQAVDGSPKRFSLLRKTWPWIKTGTRLLWAWRWPLAFVCGPVILAAVLIGSTTAGLVVSPVVGVVGPWRSPFVRSRFRHAGVRTYQIIWDLYWPLVCSLCGFVEVAGRRVRVAGLDLVSFGPGWWWRPTWIRFTVTPCATHDRTT